MTIGEIIATTSTSIVAESLKLNRPPALGSLTVVLSPADESRSPNLELYAVVTFGQTSGLDPGRRAMRLSTESVHDEAIYDRHPQLAHVLRTEFGAAMVGYCEHGRIRQHLPAKPPPLHYSVSSATEEQTRRFTDRLDYLRLILSGSGDVPPQQVLAANLREVYRQRGNDRRWLDAAAREVSVLLKDDHQALLTVLYSIDPEDKGGL